MKTYQKVECLHHPEAIALRFLGPGLIEQEPKLVG